MFACSELCSAVFGHVFTVFLRAHVHCVPAVFVERCVLCLGVLLRPRPKQTYSGQPVLRVPPGEGGSLESGPAAAQPVAAPFLAAAIVRDCDCDCNRACDCDCGFLANMFAIAKPVFDTCCAPPNRLQLQLRVQNRFRRVPHRSCDSRFRYYYCGDCDCDSSSTKAEPVAQQPVAPPAVAVEAPPAEVLQTKAATGPPPPVPAQAVAPPAVAVEAPPAEVLQAAATTGPPPPPAPKAPPAEEGIGVFNVPSVLSMSQEVFSRSQLWGMHGTSGTPPKTLTTPILVSGASTLR